MVMPPACVLRRAKPGERKHFLFGRMILTICLWLWVIRPHSLGSYSLAAGLYFCAWCLPLRCPWVFALEARWGSLLVPGFLWEPVDKSLPLSGICKPSLDVSKREAKLFHDWHAPTILIISFSFWEPVLLFLKKFLLEYSSFTVLC